MNIEKAKEIQDIMNRIEADAKILLESQVNAGAMILKAITADEPTVNIEPVLWALITSGGELRLRIDELMDVINSVLDDDQQ